MYVIIHLFQSNKHLSIWKALNTGANFIYFTMIVMQTISNHQTALLLVQILAYLWSYCRKKPLETHLTDVFLDSFGRYFLYVLSC